MCPNPGVWCTRPSYIYAQNQAPKRRCLLFFGLETCCERRLGAAGGSALRSPWEANSLAGSLKMVGLSDSASYCYLLVVHLIPQIYTHDWHLFFTSPGRILRRLWTRATQLSQLPIATRCQTQCGCQRHKLLVGATAVGSAPTRHGGGGGDGEWHAYFFNLKHTSFLLGSVYIHHRLAMKL